MEERPGADAAEKSDRLKARRGVLACPGGLRYRAAVMIGPRILLTAIVVIITPPALAQDGETIVVTAAGLDDARGEAALSIVTLDRAALDRAPSDRLENILGQVAGFQMFRPSDTRSANPTSQGATLRGLGGSASSRALVILDGVPQSDPFGGWISWVALDPARLGEVRVTRGGGSGIFGPGALAGTIELSSRSAEQFEPLSANALHGSRDSIESNLGAMFPPFDNALLAVSASYARGDGFIPIVEEQRGPVDIPARYAQRSANIRLAAPIGRAIEMQAAGTLFRDERNRGFAFSDNLTEGGDASLRLLGRGGWQWEALAYYQDREFASEFAGIDAARTLATPVLDQYSVPANGLGGRFELRPLMPEAIELRLGGDIRRTAGRTRERFLFVAGAPTREREAGGETLTWGGFADVTLRAASELTLTGSARLDRWSISDGFLVQSDIGQPPFADERFEDRSGWQFTGRAGLAWRPENALTIRAAGYTGWRLPTLNELFRPFRVGADATAANAGLEPETLAGVEAGVDYAPSSFIRFGGTVFYNRLEDAIANVTLGQGPGVFPGVGFVGADGSYSQRRNIDAVRAAGIELDGRAALGEWSLAGSYAFTDAEVAASGAAAPLDGLRPAQIARHSASLTLGYARAFGPGGAITLRYLGARFEDDLNSQRLDDALIIGARALVPIYSGLKLELRGENLLNARVEAAVSGTGTIERATPRTLWAGLRFEFF